MLKRFISTYSLKYPRSIVYMLQACEYKIGDYLKWYFRVVNFRLVEKRKHLVQTIKAKILLGIIALIIGFLISVISVSLINHEYLLAVAFVLLWPYAIAFGLLVPLFLIKVFVQKPLEYFMIKKAQQRLSKHPGIKIAVAGSFGKTTMREILKAVLGADKIVVAPPENHNTLLGISRFIQSLKRNEEIVIFEFGEYYPGDIKEMCKLFKPTIGVITGVNEAHLDKFKTIQATTDTIFELADWLGNKNLYVNGENKLSKDRTKPNNFVYTKNGVGALEVKKFKSDLTGTYFTLGIGQEYYDFHSNLLGVHQIGPLVCAIHLALSLGIKMENIKSGIENTKPFMHRMEPREDSSGVVIIDDSYNGNPDGVSAVIKFLASLEGKRKIYITPGLVEMGNKVNVVHEKIGQELAQANIDKVILIRNSVTPYIEKGLMDFNYHGEVIWFDNGPAAFAALPHLTVSGDVVLLQNDWPDQYY